MSNQSELEGQRRPFGESTDSPSPKAWVVAVACIAVATAISVAIQSAGLLAAVPLAIAGLAVLAVAATALARIEWFLLIVLAIRPAADALQKGDEAGIGGVVLTGGVVLVGGAWCVLNRLHGMRIIRSRQGLFLLAVGAVCALSSLGAVDVFASLNDVGRLLSSVVVFLLLDRLIDGPRTAARVLLAGALSAVVPLGVGLVQLAQGMDRIEGTIPHPNAFGFYLSTIIIASVAMLPDLRGKARIALSVLCAVSAVELVFTYSRGAWIAVVLGIATVGILKSRKLLVGLGVLLVAVAVLVPSAVERAQEVEESRPLVGSEGNSFIWRLNYWGEIVGLADERPVTGIGLGMTRVVSGGDQQPHNDFLRMYVEAGLLGALAFGAAIASFIALAITAHRRWRNTPRHGLSAAYAGELAAFLSFSIGSNVIVTPVPFWSFLIVTAVTTALLRIETKEGGDVIDLSAQELAGVGEEKGK